MTFKQAKKQVEKCGFILHQADDCIILIHKRTNKSQHYDTFEELEPDIEEILEGGCPFQVPNFSAKNKEQKGRTQWLLLIENCWKS